MKVPYNCLHAHGSVLFAARGGKIHTFGLPAGNYIATWKHPALATRTVAEARQAVESGGTTDGQKQEAKEADISAPADNNEAEPPAKRQRVAAAAAEDEGAELQAATAAAYCGEEEQRPGRSKGKGKGKGSRHRAEQRSLAADGPVIIQLATTDDGAHLVAVSGNDKTVWVFSHDGSGRLTQLSRRTMPKRPSSIAVAAAGAGGGDLPQQIICADKFGDVYAIPLLQSNERPPPPCRSSARPVSSTSRSSQKPAATVLTVHSKGNRAALAAQERELANRTTSSGGGGGGSNKNSNADGKVEAPGFEHTLLLGHVSMLTAVRLASDGRGRRYILTSDRDEHIRVSRYLPQAHVIHGYCLGHREFVADMVVASPSPPPRTGEERSLLVSGGGDAELIVWDWLQGRILSRTDVLSVAREVAPPQTDSVAVSRLFTLEYPSSSEGEEEVGPKKTFVLALCEGLPAILTWQLVEDDTLTRPGIIQLPGNPLDLAVFTTASSSSADSEAGNQNRKRPGLAVALHIQNSSATTTTVPQDSLHVISLALDDARLAVDTLTPIRDDALPRAENDEEQDDVSDEQVRALFYVTEQLRKQRIDAPGQDEGNTGQDVQLQQVQDDADATKE